MPLHWGLVNITREDEITDWQPWMKKQTQRVKVGGLELSSQGFPEAGYLSMLRTRTHKRSVICVISPEVIFILPEPRSARNRLQGFPNQLGRERERDGRGEEEKEKESETGRWDCG